MTLHGHSGDSFSILVSIRTRIPYMSVLAPIADSVGLTNKPKERKTLLAVWAIQKDLCLPRTGPFDVRFGSFPGVTLTKAALKLARSKGNLHCEEVIRQIIPID